MFIFPDTMDAVVYDDEQSFRDDLSKILKKTYKLEKVTTRDNIISLSVDLVLEQPRLLILDYLYENGLDLPFVTPAVQHYKGWGIIYSSVDRDIIEKTMGPLPSNFFVVKKGNLLGLRKILDSILKAG